MSFGKRVRKQRLILKLSQQEFANEIGVSKALVSQWENDKTNPNDIKNKNLKSLYYFTKKDRDYYFEGIESGSSNNNPNNVEVDRQDMFVESALYVLNNAPQLSNVDTAIAMRMLFNKVKDKNIILKSDLEKVLSNLM